MFAKLKSFVGKTLTGHETSFQAIKSFNCLGAVYPSKLSTDQELINRRYIKEEMQNIIYSIEELILSCTPKTEVEQFIHYAGICEIDKIPALYSQYYDKYSDHWIKQYTLMLFSFMKIWDLQGKELTHDYNGRSFDYATKEYFKVVYSVKGDTAIIPVLVCLNYMQTFASYETSVYAKLISDKLNTGEYPLWEELALVDLDLNQALRTHASSIASVQFALPFSHAEYASDITDSQLYYKTGPHPFNALDFGDVELQTEYEQIINNVKASLPS